MIFLVIAILCKLHFGSSLAAMGLLVAAFGAGFSGLILNSISQRSKELVQILKKMEAVNTSRVLSKVSKSGVRKAS